MAKYLITGGCGFIGSQLSKKLIEQGHEVIVVDDLSNGTIIHPQATFVKRDITQLDAIIDLFIGISGCFHLAAKPIVQVDLDHWFNFHAINLGGSLNVFKAALNAGNIPVVYASSCAVYGNAAKLPLHEEQVIHPLSAYGCDKLSTELNAFVAAHEYQLPSIGLRFFNVYGPYQQPTSPYSGVISRFITNILEDKPVTIFGDGTQTRDFVFVEDVVDNLIHAMKILKEGAQVVNVCTGNKTSINQLLNLISKLLHRQGKIEYEPAREFDVLHSRGNPKKMEAYGFDIKHDIKQGLLKTVDYFVRAQSQLINMPKSLIMQDLELSHAPLGMKTKDSHGFADLSLTAEMIEALIRLKTYTEIGVLIVNIDDFKLVNGLIGTYVGDLLLNKVVERITKKFLGTAIVARKKSDEFVLVLLNQSISEIETKAQHLLEILAKPFVLNAQKIYITASIGISLWPQDACQADDLLAHAYMALDYTKKNSKNNYHFYTREGLYNIRYLQQIQNHLSRIFEPDALYLCYQPQIEVSSKRVVGCEALLRWNSAQLGIVPPHDFIPVAEKTGQIVPIGNWVLHRACLEAASWQKKGRIQRIAINVSVSQLQCRHISPNSFLSNVEHALQESGLKPELLELEITESILMKMDDEALEIIRKLKKIGVRISCDDFGSGYSSYSRLQQLPLDTIKIDQSLVQNMSHKLKNTTSIVHSIILMARELNISTIAEGVETQEQWDILKKLGCHIIQGNLISEPALPIDLNLILKPYF